MQRATRMLALSVALVTTALVAPPVPASAAVGDLTFLTVPASDADGPRAATDVALGPDGNPWFLATSTTGADDVLGRVNPDLGIDTFPIGGSGDGQLVTGPDGRLWIASDALYKVWPDGTVVRKSRPGRGVYRAVVAGPRNHLWLLLGRKLKELDRGGRTLRTFRLPHPGNDVALGPDGNLWVTWSFGGLDRVKPWGRVTTFVSPTVGTAQPHDLQGITAGPDGKLWVAAHFESALPRNFAEVCKVSTGGRYRCFAGPNGVHLVTVGPDDRLYVDRATRVDLSTSVTPPAIRRYDVDGAAVDVEDPGLHDLRALAPGSVDSVWFAQDPGDSGATLGRLQVT